MARDKRVDAQLKELGWLPIHFWEKQALKNTDECVNTILELINNTKQ